MDEKDNTSELVVVDVRRYKRVKRALAESEERFRQLFENVPIGIYRTTPDGRIVDSNPALVAMLGYDSFAELAARNLEQEFSDATYSRLDFIARLERDGEIKGLEAIWKRKDGSLIYVRENAKLVRSESGQVYFEGTVEDITQSKKAEEAQRIRTQQVEILNCIISKGNTAESLPEMLEVILDCVTVPLAFDTVGIFMYDHENRQVRMLASRGASTQFALSENYMSIDNLPFSRVLLHGQAVYLENAQKELHDFYTKWGWRMAGSVPLVAKGRVVGALNVASCRRAVFSSEERDILEMIGKEAGTLVSKLQTEVALRESEKYYRTLIDTSPDIIVVMGLDAMLLTVNQQFLKVGGYFYDEAIGKSSFDFVDGLERDFLANKTAVFVEKKKVSGSEYRFKKKNGQSVPLEVSASVLCDDSGSPRGIIAIGRDISERMRSEAALRESEEKFRSIAEQTSDLIAITDNSGAITYASSSAKALFQYTPGEMVGHNFMEFLDAPSIPRAVAAFRDDLEHGGKSVGLELTMKRKDGSTFAGELNGSSFRYGAQYGSLVVIRDIDLRKRAEEQLRFLGSVTENTSEAIIVTDSEFAINYINKVGEKLFGYTMAEVKGKSPGMFNADPRAAQIQNRLYKIVSSGKTYLGESLNRRKDGSTFYCEYKVMPLMDGNGNIYAYSSVQRDISERKRKDEELRQSEETFRRTFEAIPDPAYIWTRHGDGRILLGKFNQAAEKITENKIKDFLGIEAEKLFADHPGFVKKIILAMDKGKRQFEEVLYTYQSTNKSRWLQTDYVKTAGDNVLVITKDITESKEAEAKLLAYQEQLRALTSELGLIEERERRRIASELHDQIGQNLALCKLKVAALEKGAAGEELKGELSAVRRLLECSIQDVRSLIFDLSPPVLYELGFQAALEWLAEWIGEQYHVAIEFENRSGEEPMENDRQVILFQIVRELLVNVGKHSQASQAKVIMSLEKQSLKIQVNDDGVGFDATQIYDAKGRNGGFGFFSMRERLNYLGGELEVKSKPGQGTQIILLVPPGARSQAGKKEEA